MGKLKGFSEFDRLDEKYISVKSRIKNFREFTVKPSDKKIQEQILNLKRLLLNLRFQKSSGQLEKTSQIKNTRKEIARLKTKLVDMQGVKNA